MTLERDPNSSNLFYVKQDLFPISNSARDSVDLDESTGKFTFTLNTGARLSIPAQVYGGVGGRTLFVFLQEDLYNSIDYAEFVAGSYYKQFDQFSLYTTQYLSGDKFYGYMVETESSVDTDSVTLDFVWKNAGVGRAGPQGIMLSEIDRPGQWESAYREAKIDIDPALSSKLITVGQLSRLTGSGTASGAQSDKLLTMGQLARLMGKAAPPDNQKGKFVTLSQLKRVQTLKIVSWADGTDEEIAAMVAAADAGKIDLSDYWHEGDTRTVNLSAMPVTYVGESHAAQSVQFVLSDPGHFTLANGKKCNFVVLQKDCLKESGYMNGSATNSGGWNSCQRRTWCNNVYRNAIPATLRPIFKQFTTYAANGTGSTSTASTDWFALPSEMEIFGSTTYANSSAESKNSQLTWFKTSSNRIKRMNGSAYFWWERSPRTSYSNSFCGVNYRGYADWDIAYNSYGLAPFGCI